MTKAALLTLFAPAERAKAEDLHAQCRTLSADSLVHALLDCFPEPAMILNQQRQVVLANDKLAHLLQRPRETLIGLRPGEALACAHSEAEPAGCGTTRSCQYCGAVNAILATQSSAQPDVRECRIQRAIDGRTMPLDLRIWATPLKVGDELFTVLALKDTTDENRRQVLERLFFHDVLNTAGALGLLLRVLPHLKGDEAIEAGERAQRLINELTEEIQSQRDLAAAERGDLIVRARSVDAVQLLERVCTPYRRRAMLERKALVIQKCAEAVLLESDERLLRRVLANLVKNALEASEPGQTVTVSIHASQTPTFCVHNESPMPERVQAQIFQRSFSTKEGVGRGVGTYSVKLLTEDYLQGTADFRSTPGEGTTFIIRLPRRLRAAGSA